MANGSNHTVIVTGGNRGLGLETSRQLAEQGYRVVLSARRRADAEQAARSIGKTVLATELDVTSAESIAKFAAWAKAELGSVQALVNNAGISMQGFNVQVVQGTLAVNFFGALHVTNALAPFLVDGGNLVMVSSGMGELTAYSPELKARFLDPALTVDGVVALVSEFEREVATGTHNAHGWPSSAYRVSKAALNALVRIWGKSWPRLHVNAVCPGWVKTDMGGPGAPRELPQGARGIVWAATLPANGPSGGFFRDSKPIPW
ncbi:MAG TPA: SDR family NAD(P)-dependent oxidoreductase [Polyangiaceae bacterium]|nr:SDR family NAD(P)-dependent oxidoreductase [Polyangiaceae bacterium]